MLPGRRDALGRLDVTTDPVAATSVLQGGIAVNPLGQVHITNVIPGLGGASFHAPLKTSLLLDRGVGDPTFTRATTAYVTDFEGLQKQVPSGCARFTGARAGINYLSNSEVPTKVGSVTLTAGQTDPLGGTAAYKVDFAATGSGNRVVYSSIGANPVGITGNISVWMRGEVGGEQVKLWDGWTVDAVTHTLTTIWKRYTFSFTTNNSISVMIYTTAGTPTIYTAFAQGEGSGSAIPYEYISVGVLSAPYHGAGADGVKYFATENGNSVASGVVTEATGAAIPDATLKGYFAEGQRQNRCLYSQDFTNAAWVSGGGGIAVTPNTAVAPDGTTTADTLTASGANGTLIQDLGVVASAAKAGGMWLKRKTGTGNIDLTLDGGSTWTTVAVTSDWLPLEKTQTLADEDFGIRIVTSGDEVYAWQGQVETASFISSPIPTTTAAVTRNGDVLTYASSGNFSGTVGTAYIEAVTYQPSSLTTQVSLITTGSGSDGIIADVATVATTLRSRDGTNVLYATGLPILGAAMTKNAVRWGTDMGVTRNGAAVQTSLFDGTHATTSICIGNEASVGNYAIYGSVRNVRIWDTALSSEEMQDITSPGGSIVEPSELNFINGFMVNNTGQLVVKPGGVITHFLEGLPRTAEGVLVVQTDTVPAATDPFVGGIRVGPLGGVYTTLAAPVAGDPPVNTVPPDITGDARVGATLTCDDGTWEGTAPITYTYQWYQGINVIIGATTNSYVVQAQDLGAVLLCMVTATNAVGAASKVSEPGVRIVSARYDYKNIASTPASGQVVSGSASAPLQVRINAIDKDGLNHAGPLSRLQIGDSIFVGTQEGILTAEPIELSGYFILETAAWPLLADGEYDVTLGFN